MGRFILIGRLLALHDLWATGRINSTIWRAHALPVMKQLHNEKSSQS